MPDIIILLLLEFIIATISVILQNQIDAKNMQTLLLLHNNVKMEKNGPVMKNFIPY